jgi:purine-binding chemotaxis protein CheW
MASVDQYIELGIAGESYGIKIEHIHEIIRVQQITQIPNSKPYMTGVINLRGSIVPIVSLRSRFSIGESQATSSTRIIVVNMDEVMVGLVVDRVQQVITIDHIQPPPEQVGALEGKFISGMGQANGQLIGILKLNEILGLGAGELIC